MMRWDEASLRSRGGSSAAQLTSLDESVTLKRSQRSSWRRILLLIIAITVHNIPGLQAYYVPLNNALLYYQEPVE